MHPAVTFDPEKLAAVCRKHHVLVLEAFGSAVRDDFDPNRSDVDLIVRYDRAKRRASLLECDAFAFMEIGEDMAEVFGRETDVVNVDAVSSPHFLPEAMKATERLYAA